MCIFIQVSRLVISTAIRTKVVCRNLAQDVQNEGRQVAACDLWDRLQAVQ